MPRTSAKVPLAYSDDPAFCALTYEAQHVFVLIQRQPDFSRCGVLGVNARRLARQAVNLSADIVDAAIDELAEHGFAVYDADTGEVAVPTFFRHDGLLAHGWGLNAAVSDYRKVHSATVRQAVLDRVPEKHRDRFSTHDPDVDDGALPFPQDDLRPQPTARDPLPLSRHVTPVDSTGYPQSRLVERETKVLAVVVERRIARSRDTGTVIHSEVAYRARVVDQVRAELLAVARRAIGDNPQRSDTELAELLDPDRPVAASVRTRERPSIDSLGQIDWER